MGVRATEIRKGQVIEKDGDLLLITEEGAEVLTDAAPREREDIEARIKDRGVFDWMDNRKD